MFEPQSEAFAINPYKFYADLRELDEPYFYEGADAYLLSRYSDVEGAARNPTLVRSLDAFMDPNYVKAQQRARGWHDMPNHERFVQFSLLERDGAIHFRLRVIVLRALSRRFIEQQRGMIETYVDRLLDQLLQQKEFDFVADLASHVPGHIIGHLLGVPDKDCPQLRIWSENIVQFFDVGRTQAHKILAENATTEFYFYLSDLIAERRKKPQEDLISSLVAAQDAGEMSESELISTCMLILAAGHGSTIDVLGSGMHTLVSYPEQMRLLRQEPRHIQMAVRKCSVLNHPCPSSIATPAKHLSSMGSTIPGAQNSVCCMAQRTGTRISSPMLIRLISPATRTAMSHSAGELIFAWVTICHGLIWK